MLAIREQGKWLLKSRLDSQCEVLYRHCFVIFDLVQQWFHHCVFNVQCSMFNLWPRQALRKELMAASADIWTSDYWLSKPTSPPIQKKRKALLSFNKLITFQQIQFLLASSTSNLKLRFSIQLCSHFKNLYPFKGQLEITFKDQLRISTKNRHTSRDRPQILVNKKLIYKL